MSQEDDKGFKVSDRRHLREKEGEQTAKGPDSGPEVGEDTAAGGPGAPEAASGGPDAGAPQVDFVSFVLSLASAVLIHLGEIPDPMTQQKETNLELARQTLDLLGLLQDKTKGNLTEDESRTLETLLADLRFRFLKASKFIS